MTATTLPLSQRTPLARSWADGWWAACHLVLSLLLLGWHLAVLVLLVVGAALTPVLLTGVPLLLLGRWGAQAALAAERWRHEALLGAPLPPRLPAVADGRPWWRRALLDPQPWRTSAHLLLVCTWGALAGAVVATLTGLGIAGVLAPVTTGGRALSWPFVGPGYDMPVGGGVVLVVAALLLLVVPWLAQVLAGPEAAAARVLLAPSRAAREAALQRRVVSLTETREAAVDSVEAERRRIERDLHDGPQQRLVALAMQLGMAQRALDRDPSAAQQLLDRAHGTAKEAIADMRLVARGIHPPVLTDRGLDAALSALAAQSAVPVTVRSALDPAREGRPSATTEAIAYFVVSEALTNVAKHAAASRAVVELERRSSEGGDRLVVRVSDDGRGGARPAQGPVAPGAGGSGLRGLTARVAAVDGRLRLDSPAGGPTVLTAELPWGTREDAAGRGGAR